MKKSYFTKKFSIAIVVLVCLFVNYTNAQDIFTWNGSSSNNWATAANWTKTGTASADTFPGQTPGRLLDFVAIENGGTPNVASGSYGMFKLTISNATGAVTGSTLTISSGATISVTGPGNTGSEVVWLRGGNIVNNGTFNVTGTLITGVSSNANYGFTCGLPVVIPTVATQYGYSGSGALNLNTSVGNQFSGGFIFTGFEPTAPKATYKFLFNGATNFQLSPIATGGSSLVRFLGSSTLFPCPVIFGGTGFSMGSATAGVSNAMFTFSGNGINFTIESGTSCTIYGNSLNANNFISSYSYGTSAANIYFTNKGTLNFFGTTTRSAFTLSTEWNSVMTFENQGVVNVDITSTGAGQAAIALPIQGSQNTAAGPNVSTVNIINSGTLNLKNQMGGLNSGSVIVTSNDPKSPALNLNNTGTLNMTGSNFNSGGNANRSFLINSGTITTNQELRAINTTNNPTGVITFTNTGATSPTKVATFTVPMASSVTLGATYTDGSGNVHTVLNTKVTAVGNAILTSVPFNVTVPGLGSLTRVTGIGDLTIGYSSLSILTRNALFSYTLNKGTINTTTGPAYLNVISGVNADGALCVLSPGGNAGKGIAINTATLDPNILSGTYKIQVSGNTTAGVDYDQYISTGQAGGFDLSAGILDVTGIYTPTVATTIDIMTTYVDADPSLSGAIIGNFASVVGLTPGWSVNYTLGLGGKVRLVFNPNLGIGDVDFADFKFNYYPNPATNVLNIASEKNINTVEFFNFIGQKVISNTVNATQKQFDTSSLQNGIYFMEVTIENAKKSFKIIKK